MTPPDFTELTKASGCHANRAMLRRFGAVAADVLPAYESPVAAVRMAPACGCDGIFTQAEKPSSGMAAGDCRAFAVVDTRAAVETQAGEIKSLRASLRLDRNDR